MQRKINELDTSAQLPGADALFPDTIPSEGLSCIVAHYLFRFGRRLPTTRLYKHAFGLERKLLDVQLEERGLPNGRKCTILNVMSVASDFKFGSWDDGSRMPRQALNEVRWPPLQIPLVTSVDCHHRCMYPGFSHLLEA